MDGGDVNFSLGGDFFIGQVIAMSHEGGRIAKEMIMGIGGADNFYDSGKSSATQAISAFVSARCDWTGRLYFRAIFPRPARSLRLQEGKKRGVIIGFTSSVQISSSINASVSFNELSVVSAKNPECCCPCLPCRQKHRAQYFLAILPR